MLINPNHACQAWSVDKGLVQVFRIILFGLFLDPGTIEGNHGRTTGSQYVFDLGYLVRHLALITEVHGTTGECVAPLGVVYTIPVRCQYLIAIGSIVGINTPYGGIETFEPVVATADVHTGQGADPK